MSGEKNFSAKVALYGGIIGTVLGIIGTVLGIYQIWFGAPTEQRIAVALDVSRTYLREVALDRASILLLIKGQDPDQTAGRLTEAELEKVRSLADTLEFYARLAEEKRLDPDYLSEALVCAIVFAADTAQKYNLSIPTNGKPLALIDFAKSHRPCRAGALQ
jgi:hypothetical protein